MDVQYPSDLNGSGLTFQALREANLARSPKFRNRHGETQHSGRDWTTEDWAMATIGELGETANVLKKVRRGDYTMAEMRDKVAREISDTVIYLDFLAHSCDIVFEPRGLKSFPALRMATRANGRMVLPPMGVSETLVAAFVSLGRAVSMIEKARSEGPRGASIGGIHLRLTTALSWLDRLADICEIDLGQSVIETFNAKSVQLELDLFILRNV